MPERRELGEEDCEHIYSHLVSLITQMMKLPERSPKRRERGEEGVCLGRGSRVLRAFNVCFLEMFYITYKTIDVPGEAGKRHQWGRKGSSLGSFPSGLLTPRPKGRKDTAPWEAAQGLGPAWESWTPPRLRVAPCATQKPELDPRGLAWRAAPSLEFTGR